MDGTIATIVYLAMQITFQEPSKLVFISSSFGAMRFSPFHPTPNSGIRITTSPPPDHHLLAKSGFTLCHCGFTLGGFAPTLGLLSSSNGPGGGPES